MILNDKVYLILYVIMLGCFLILSTNMPTLRMKTIGLLITVVNALLYWR
jgi:hypothetical protein